MTGAGLRCRCDANGCACTRAGQPVATPATLAVLQAESDENTQRKGLTPYEAARARERRARVLAEDAARRQRDHAGTAPGRSKAEVTSSKLDEVKPSDRATRKAAAIGTGYSGTTLDKVDTIRSAAERGVVRQGREEIPVPEPVREVARQQLEGVKQTGAAVDRAHRASLRPFEDAPPEALRQRGYFEYIEMAALSYGAPLSEAAAALIDAHVRLHQAGRYDQAEALLSALRQHGARRRELRDRATLAELERRVFGVAEALVRQDQRRRLAVLDRLARRVFGADGVAARRLWARVHPGRRYPSRQPRPDLGPTARTAGRAR